jgi:transposase
VSNTELLPKSKPEPVHRLEVFTGTGRRRSWTAEQKARIVAESYEGEETICAVARRHGLTPQQLFSWRREARRRMEDGVGESGPAFVPVVVATADRRDAPTGQANPGGSPIEIVIGAATVRVAPGIDTATLTKVLRAVRAAT